jgi:hypothetical protein
LTGVVQLKLDGFYSEIFLSYIYNWISVDIKKPPFPTQKYNSTEKSKA